MLNGDGTTRVAMIMDLENYLAYIYVLASFPIIIYYIRMILERYSNGTLSLIDYYTLTSYTIADNFLLNAISIMCNCWPVEINRVKGTGPGSRNIN